MLTIAAITRSNLWPNSLPSRRGALLSCRHPINATHFLAHWRNLPSSDGQEVGSLEDTDDNVRDVKHSRMVDGVDTCLRGALRGYALDLEERVRERRKREEGEANVQDSRLKSNRSSHGKM